MLVKSVNRLNVKPLQIYNKLEVAMQAVYKSGNKIVYYPQKVLFDDSADSTFGDDDQADVASEGSSVSAQFKKKRLAN